MENYVYQPLEAGQFRLFKFNRGNIGHRIKCQIQNVPFNVKHRYVALSYVWGASSTERKISLNGHDLGIGENLYVAIDQLRAHEEQFTTHFGWIDALCINQKDNAEKAQQVQFMDRIYGGARISIAWIGVPTSIDEIYCEEIFDAVSQEAYPSYGDTAAAYTIPRRLMMDNKEPGYSERLFQSKRCIEELMVNPWFDRVWTLQEFIMGNLPGYSRKLHYGRLLVSMTSFINQCAFPGLEKAHPTTLGYSDYLKAWTRMHAMDQLIDWADKRGMSWLVPTSEVNETVAADQLLNLLDTSAQRRCTQPHDTIYGVLGLWHYVRCKPLPENLKPNYDAAYAEACRECSAYLLTHTRDLRIIAKRGGNFQTEVPSWVPDLSYLGLRSDHMMYTVDRAQVKVLPNGQELSMGGCQFAYVVDGIASSNQLQHPYTSASWESFTRHIVEFEDKILMRAITYKSISIEAGREQSMWLCDDSIVESYNFLRDYQPTGTESVSDNGFKPPSAALGETAEWISKTMILMDSGHVLFADGDIVQARPGDMVVNCKGDSSLFNPATYQRKVSAHPNRSI
ncbi:hypothetical protein sscle_03g022280 [Sclerotinia sclerotiorum 1980 UF-70]|uniref:Heterokaryon incompatibility domain-containing protein n=1 Tax=Sclerotinia sclerotiorum (strain ATCC 18683 / 1980 / Ss-1) TaxID=665079 RepID=A0A1D9PXL4_SCLS1|nr:hypothetical protein sscle_03g022280 [Sclerotinia sclerotiorum 1980 UF-70]